MNSSPRSTPLHSKGLALMPTLMPAGFEKFSPRSISAKPKPIPAKKVEGTPEGGGGASNKGVRCVGLNALDPPNWCQKWSSSFMYFALHFSLDLKPTGGMCDKPFVIIVLIKK